ncbi:hypothetical protein NA57DRAFT_41385 [Rhizodiscina lignyota]|uniref:Uncharacterized protein n=1 Tax=Rhizodiscina lignyota TaxID=1504668 RepID=A0A9P4M951_9PEZI|nr:hypothetical protein NA57DRAFT_41385 [Rhizodiscina lignyota]
MTTAIAPPPSSSALAPPSIEQSAGSRSYPAIAPSNSTPAGTPATRSNRPSNGHSPSSNHESPPQRTPSRAAPPPKVIVKKEPSSPEMANSRHRPRRLDLSKGANSTNGQPSAGPRTSKESAGLAIQDVGLACLSPGFHTQDPGMREQLQRSMNVREQQRLIIEARQKGTSTGNKSTPPDQTGDGPSGLFRPTKPPGTSRRKGPPPGLSINAPSHEQFANERVIQSAPLNQTFTGLNRSIHPLTRQVANQPSGLSNTSHIHHVPATQTNNRLPPISDVFPGDSFQNGPQSSRAAAFPHNNSPGHSSHSNVQPPLPSPGLPPPQQQQHQAFTPVSQGQFSQPPPASAGRPREYKSAEEALNNLAGGREELLPRIVHYGGHQPPTPPSPMPHQKRDGLPVPSGSAPGSSADRMSRRRDRDEFERDMSPPALGRRRTGEALMAERREDREARWAEGRWERDSPETRQRKKEEFISLCGRAWDLFHS